MSQTVPFTEELAREYQAMFDTATIRPERAGEVRWAVGRVLRPASLARYTTVARATGVPVPVVGILHCLEAALSFDGHLHNGDPLDGRTVRVPANRPATGQPPFAWEDSAIDALRLKKLDSWSDWSLPGIAYVFEGYNGFGYRTKGTGVPSPYLWSATTAYTAGKFVADHRFDPMAVSRQCGAMALLRHMLERGGVSLPPTVG